MNKNGKKLESSRKRDLQFLIEDFLEKDRAAVSKDIKGEAGKAKELWDRLGAILFKDSFWMDELGQKDLVGTDFEKLILEYHVFLTAIWRQFKVALFDYRFRVVPEREKTAELKKRIHRDPPSVLSDYKELLDHDTVIDWEQFYDIKITVSFDPGHITVYDRSLNLVKNFLGVLADAPISYFASCEYCGNCIVLTRSDKRYCRNCAAKRFQADKWKQDPEEMKKKEKERYHSKRKKKDATTIKETTETTEMKE